MTLLLLAASGVAQLFGVAVAATYLARVKTATTVFAGQKVEALRALAWSDSALSLTAADALDSNQSGSVEHLDSRGIVVSTSTTAPPIGRFIRRWSIQALPADPGNCLILQVLVTTAEADRRATRPRQRMGGDALITSILTRTGR